MFPAGDGSFPRAVGAGVGLGSGAPRRPRCRHVRRMTTSAVANTAEATWVITVGRPSVHTNQPIRGRKRHGISGAGRVGRGGPLRGGAASPPRASRRRWRPAPAAAAPAARHGCPNRLGALDRTLTARQWLAGHVPAIESPGSGSTVRWEIVRPRTISSRSMRWSTTSKAASKPASQLPSVGRSFPFVLVIGVLLTSVLTHSLCFSCGCPTSSPCKAGRRILKVRGCRTNRRRVTAIRWPGAGLVIEKIIAWPTTSWQPTATS
jgi:hypothetical protein